MKKSIKRKAIIVRCASDIFTPIALMFGFYVILHGNISPGGGFQGGVIVAAAATLIYLGYGYSTAAKVIRMDFMRRNEALAAVCYVVLALSGIVYGFSFCRNIFADMGVIGDLLSSGTISLMSYAVGYKVLTGVGFLMLMMLGLLAPDDEDEEETAMDEDDGEKEEHA